MGDVADDGLSALFNVHALDNHALLSLAAIALQSLNLGHICTGEAV